MKKEQIEKYLADHSTWLYSKNEEGNKANLQHADLRDADLRYAYLQHADLQHANLRYANLRYANLQHANLQHADLQHANTPYFQICPEEGSFIAWKKISSGLCKLLIPEDAERTSCLISRKCRASRARVLEGNGISTFGKIKTEYKKGEMVYADSFCNDIRIDCSYGIHFFMTKKEAEDF